MSNAFVTVPMHQFARLSVGVHSVERRESTDGRTKRLAQPFRYANIYRLRVSRRTCQWLSSFAQPIRHRE
jgi:hypothetical protein